MSDDNIYSRHHDTREFISSTALYSALSFLVLFFFSPIVLLIQSCRRKRYDNIPYLLFLCGVVCLLSSCFLIMSQYTEKMEQFVSYVIYGLGAIFYYLYLLVFTLIGNVSKLRKFFQFVFLAVLTFVCYYLIDLTELYNDEENLEIIALVSTGLMFILQGQKIVNNFDLDFRYLQEGPLLFTGLSPYFGSSDVDRIYNTDFTR